MHKKRAMAKKQKEEGKTVAAKKAAGAKPSKRMSRAEYDKLRRSAYEYVVEHLRDQKEVAEMLGVSEQTMSDWSRKGGWRELREAKQQCYSTDADNNKKIIRLLSTKRLALEIEAQEAGRLGNADEELALRKQAKGISDEISKHNKTLVTLDKENRVTLGVYIDVMESLFDALRQYDEELFDRCVDFQAQHVRKKIIELG